MNAIFRPEAIAHRERRGRGGDVLRYESTWAGRAYILIIFACVAAFAFVSLFSVDEWASGRCVVRIDSRRALTATQPGTVDAVEAKPGAMVEAGTILVRLSDDDAARELDRASREFELQLVRLLRDPNDLEAKNNLTALRTRRDQAQNEVDARIIRAPIAGYVTDVRARPGQRVNPGEVVVAIVPPNATQVSVLALVPADYRPMLENGQKMRFELDGFRYEYADLEVQEVSSEAIGPTEVARVLGEDRVGTVGAPNELGAKVLVSAKLPSATFTSEGQPFGYFDGLTGNAEIRVHREPLLVMLVPALRMLIPH